MSNKMKYVVVSGKHMDKNGDFVRQGGTIELTKAEADSFPGKFKPVLEQVAAAEAPAPDDKKAEGGADDKKSGAPAPAADAKK